MWYVQEGLTDGQVLAYIATGIGILVALWLPNYLLKRWWRNLKWIHRLNRLS